MFGNFAEISRRESFLLLVASALPAFAKIGSVEIGVCASIDKFPKATAFDFDYFEPAVAAIAVLSDQAFADFRQQVLSSPLRCTSCNSFIRTLNVVGPNVDADALKAYMRSALDRCRQLGTQIVVWGSASSRNVPPGYSSDKAWEQMKVFLSYAGDIARSRNVVVAIEPLRRAESNIVNTGAEALRLVEEVNHPNVKMIIDYYHLRSENENSDILLNAAGQIAPSLCKRRQAPECREPRRPSRAFQSFFRSKLGAAQP